MAKHLVKCKYCGETFDTNEEPFIKVSARRYAHRSCALKYEQLKTQEQKDEEEFFKYTKKLFKDDYNFIATKKLANQYIKENNYTYSGMLKSLKWFYEIQNNSLDKSNGSIGIIPYIYNKAKDYYLNLFLAQKANEKKDVKQYIPTEEIIIIHRPQIKRKNVKLFDLGEDE